MSNDDSIDQFLDDSYNDHGDDEPIHPPMVVDRDDIISAHHDTVNQNVQDDYEFVRTNIKQIIETNIKGLGGLAKVAQETESPRAYEVLSGYMKQMLEANDALISLHKNVKELVSPVDNNSSDDSDSVSEDGSVHFKGTTEQFLEMLERAEAKSVESIPLEAEFIEVDESDSPE